MTRRLLVLNGLAVLMIPLHHSTFFGFQALFLWTNRYLPVSVPNYDQLGSLSFYILLFMRQLDAFGVPAFLFVSGFFVAFMARGEQKDVTLGMVLPRIRVLLIPFLFWTVIRYTLLLKVPASVDDVLDPYYFIVLLVQLYLLSPVFVPMARSNWALLLAISALLQLGASAVEFSNTLGFHSPLLDALTPLNVRWIFPARILDFTLGLVIGVHLETAKAWLAKVKWILLAGVVISLALTLVEYRLLTVWSGRAWLGLNNPGISRIVYETLVAPAFLAFYQSRVPQAKLLGDLGAKSLGIYLANIPFAYSVASILYHWAPSVLGIQLLYQPILIAVCLGGPLALMAIWRRSPARPLYRFVFG